MKAGGQKKADAIVKGMKTRRAKATKGIVPKTRMPRRMQFRIERLKNDKKFFFTVWDRGGHFVTASPGNYSRPAKALSAIKAYIEQVGRAVIVEL